MRPFGAFLFRGKMEAMKTRMFLFSIFLFIFFIEILIASPVDAVIRIMPLGDSITQGASSGVADPDAMVSYRKALWDLLDYNGYEVDFVGSENEGSAVFGDSDLADHEGHGGWTADQIRDNIYMWLDSYTNTFPVDIILIHIGTNDLSGSQNPADVVIEVSQILDEIDQYESDRNYNITVILALIVNRVNYICGNASNTTTFNDNLYNMAQSRINSGDSIVIVDMECGAGIDYQQQPIGDMWDVLHPFETGYEKMADVWFTGLQTILPDNNAPPNVPEKIDLDFCFIASANYGYFTKGRTTSLIYLSCTVLFSIAGVALKKLFKETIAYPSD
jgi:lysophospholipase L1-like esterase